MSPGNRHRVLRWFCGAAILLISVVTVATSIRFVPAYLADRSLSNQAGYLGTILGAISLLIVLVQFLMRLRSNENSMSPVERLRPKIRDDLIRLLDHMRRTSEDISLTYRSAGRSEGLDRTELARLMWAGHERIVLSGRPGRGKSYTVLQIALEVIGSTSNVIPLVVPVSRWDGDDAEISMWLARFIANEFNVSRSAARELIESNSVLALFDGLDELCPSDTETGPAEQFLKKLIEWRVQGGWTPFLLTCRYDTWRAVRQELREHHTLSPFTISPVGYPEAATYLSRSLTGTNTHQSAADLVESLRTANREDLLSNPWQLSIVAELAKRRIEADPGSSGRELADAAQASATSSAALVARYVEAVSVINAALIWRLRNVLDLWWLSKYGRYLEQNRTERTVIDGRVLPPRDLVLHRLWPIAGHRAPRVVDFVMCLLLSVPGFAWAIGFLWEQGWAARTALFLSAVVWSALLVRTSTKAWVRKATPDWSRLGDPRFSIRQALAALAIGVMAWTVVGPEEGLISFVTAWLAIGLTVGFGQTLATDTRAEIVGPLGVLKRERTVSWLSAAVVFPGLAWAFSMTWGALAGTLLAFGYAVVVGATVACALWRRYLAMIIASAFRLPPAPARLMKRMCSQGFLRVAGISYQFRHDELLRHFAYRHDVSAHWKQSLRRPGRSH